MSGASTHDVRVDVALRLGEEARRDVRELLDLTQEADGFPALSEQGRLDIESREGAGAGEVAAGTDGAGAGDPVVALTILARLAPGIGLDRLVGCALASRRLGTWSIETAVHPAHRDAPADVLADLVDAALAEVAKRGGGPIGAWLRAVTAHDAAVMTARGLAPTRELLQLLAPLPPEAARDASVPPVPVRPFRPGRDEEAWLEVNARAFADHPEQGSWTRADLERREEEPWFDPGGFLLHEIGSRIAAFCWTKVHRSPVQGEIYVIGVDPDFQGRGLGRALTRAGLGHLATRSVPTAMLYVEDTNTPAQVLYRSLGFSEHHREVLYVGEIRPHAIGNAAPA